MRTQETCSAREKESKTAKPRSIYEETREILKRHTRTTSQSNMGFFQRSVSGRNTGNAASPSQGQIKFKIGQVGDHYEQEADRVATDVASRINVQRSRIVRNSDISLQKRYTPTTVPVSPIAAGQKPLRGVEAPILPRLRVAIQQAGQGGQNLPNAVREPMEQEFGTEFRGVKIHTDPLSDSLTQSLHARAFTMGWNIFFRQGAYNPVSASGQKLLAHELTHVLHQRGSHSGALIQFDAEDDVLEVLEASDWEGEEATVQALREIFSHIQDHVETVREAVDLRDNLRTEGHDLHWRFLQGVPESYYSDLLDTLDDSVSRMAAQQRARSRPAERERWAPESRRPLPPPRPPIPPGMPRRETTPPLSEAARRAAGRRTEAAAPLEILIPRLPRPALPGRVSPLFQEAPARAMARQGEASPVAESTGPPPPPRPISDVPSTVLVLGRFRRAVISGGPEYLVEELLMSEARRTTGLRPVLLNAMLERPGRPGESATRTESGLAFDALLPSGLASATLVQEAIEGGGPLNIRAIYLNTSEVDFYRGGPLSEESASGHALGAGAQTSAEYRGLISTMAVGDHQVDIYIQHEGGLSVIRARQQTVEGAPLPDFLQAHLPPSFFLQVREPSSGGGSSSSGPAPPKEATPSQPEAESSREAATRTAEQPTITTTISPQATRPRPEGGTASRRGSRPVSGGAAAGMAAFVAIHDYLLLLISIREATVGNLSDYQQRFFYRIGGERGEVFGRGGQQVIYYPPSPENLQSWMTDNIRSWAQFEDFRHEAWIAGLEIRNERYGFLVGQFFYDAVDPVIRETIQRLEEAERESIGQIRLAGLPEVSFRPSIPRSNRQVYHRRAQGLRTLLEPIAGGNDLPEDARFFVMRETTALRFDTSTRRVVPISLPPLLPGQPPTRFRLPVPRVSRRFGSYYEVVGANIETVQALRGRTGLVSTYDVTTPLRIPRLFE